MKPDNITQNIKAYITKLINKLDMNHLLVTNSARKIAD